jgi:hypothetical protein
MEEAKKPDGFEKAKFAKIASKTLKVVQEGERRAWSLDADMIDFDALSDAQLEALSKGRMPRWRWWRPTWRPILARPSTTRERQRR